MTKAEKQQINELTEMTGKMKMFEKYLDMSVHGYIRITPQDTVKLFETYYGQNWRDKVKSTVMTCGSCKLQEIRKVGMEYFAAVSTLAQLKAKENKNVEQQQRT